MKRRGLRVVFMGTPAFAVPALQALLASPHQVVAVYSQPPRPQGRGQKVHPSPVQEVATAAGIPVYTPSSFKKDPDAVSRFRDIGADIAIVAAYGLLLPAAILEIPRHGCLNIHASLLPRWRGASPIQHAIWKGDKESGITIMQMDAGLDTGPMILKEAVPISATMTTASLHDTLATLGGRLALACLNRLARGETLEAAKQDDALSTYAPLLTRNDGKIDWSLPAESIDRQVRALNPWPGTFSILPDGRRLKIIAGEIGIGAAAPAGNVLDRIGQIACGKETVYRLLKVQPENSRAMEPGEAVNGGYLTVGMKLG